MTQTAQDTKMVLITNTQSQTHKRNRDIKKVLIMNLFSIEKNEKHTLRN